MGKEKKEPVLNERTTNAPLQPLKWLNASSMKIDLNKNQTGITLHPMLKLTQTRMALNCTYYPRGLCPEYKLKAGALNQLIKHPSV